MESDKQRTATYVRSCCISFCISSHRLQSEVFYRMLNEKLSILISPTPDKTLVLEVPHREVFWRHLQRHRQSKNLCFSRFLFFSNHFSPTPGIVHLSMSSFIITLSAGGVIILRSGIYLSNSINVFYLKSQQSNFAVIYHIDCKNEEQLRLPRIFIYVAAISRMLNTGGGE